AATGDDRPGTAPPVRPRPRNLRPGQAVPVARAVRGGQVHPDLEAEQAYFDHALEQRELALSQLGRSPEPAADPKSAVQLRERLKAVDVDPDEAVAFGRTDDGEARWYIGKSAIWDHRDADGVLVVNWQAPVAARSTRRRPPTPRGWWPGAPTSAAPTGSSTSTSWCSRRRPRRWPRTRASTRRCSTTRCWPAWPRPAPGSWPTSAPRSRPPSTRSSAARWSSCSSCR